jgi:flagellin
MPVISSNYAADSALNFLNRNAGTEAGQLSRLASGSRIVEASDDASGLAIGTQLTAQASVFSQDSSNIEQAVAILQTADGAMAQISNVLQRMMALATEAASGQVTDIQRSQDINTEYFQLKTELSSIVNSTSYAGQKLLTGSFMSNVKFLVGTSSANFITVSVATISIALSGAGGLLGSGSTVSTAASGLVAMNAVTSAINTVVEDRARIGGYEFQFDFSNSNIGSNVQNTDASASVMLDADVAVVKSQLAATDVLTKAAVAALTQASTLPKDLLKLLQA